MASSIPFYVPKWPEQKEYHCYHCKKQGLPQGPRWMSYQLAAVGKKDWKEMLELRYLIRLSSGGPGWTGNLDALPKEWFCKPCWDKCEAPRNKVPIKDFLWLMHAKNKDLTSAKNTK